MSLPEAPLRSISTPRSDGRIPAVEWLYTLTALELFLGGGGRLLEIGPVTVRMILFAACLGCTALLVISGRVRGNGFLLAALLLLGFAISHFPALMFGLAKGGPLGDIFLDISPLLYWLMVPFFAIVLRSERMIERTAELIKFASLALAIFYILSVLGLAFNLIDFSLFYQRLDATGEFFFRGESLFFYKGFIYLGIGVVFYLALGGRFWRLCMVLLVSALILTLTRGLILSAAVATIFLLWRMGRRQALAVALLCIAFAAFAVWFYLPTLSRTDLLEQRAISNSIRFGDLAFMLSNFDLKTVLLGEGFGAFINGRLSIENSYLTIWWKIGALAVAFWMLPLGLAWYYFSRIQRTSSKYRLAMAFFFGVILIYVQTATNPYLNNPIGLSFVIMAVFSLRTLAQRKGRLAADVPHLSNSPAPRRGADGWAGDHENDRLDAAGWGQHAK